jgi:hypothetical protein
LPELRTGARTGLAVADPLAAIEAVGGLVDRASLEPQALPRQVVRCFKHSDSAHMLISQTWIRADNHLLFTWKLLALDFGASWQPLRQPVIQSERQSNFS